MYLRIHNVAVYTPLIADIDGYQLRLVRPPLFVVQTTLILLVPSLQAVFGAEILSSFSLPEYLCLLSRKLAYIAKFCFVTFALSAVCGNPPMDERSTQGFPLYALFYYIITCLCLQLVEVISE